MAGSGIAWIDWAFNQCVYLLVWVANALGLSYEEVNILLFVFVCPLVFMFLVTLIVRQRIEIIRLRRKHEGL
jgi:hypothetical protein